MLNLSILWLFNCISVVIGDGAYSGIWGYGSEHGPETWTGKCKSNSRQSPIDISAFDVDRTLDSLQFLNYNLYGKITLRNTGKTMVASDFGKWKENQPIILGGGLKHRYQLAQFHFHWGQDNQFGSEHAISSMFYSAEIHLVHVREDLNLEEATTRPDGIAVIAVLLATTKDPLTNSFSSISEKLPDLRQYSNDEVFWNTSTQISQFRTTSILPSNTESFYRYDGSLTTPSCNEAVIWTILAEPLIVSNQQLHLLRQLENENNVRSEKNYRPVQPLNGRRVIYRPSSEDKKTMNFSKVNIDIGIIASFFVFKLVLK